MPNPYMLMTMFYILLAAFFALDASFANLGWVAWFNGLRWLRVHFITLGVLIEITFGILPALVAARGNKPRPGTRWDVWLLLNVGLIVLAVGVPLVNQTIIFSGGALIFIAAILLLRQLLALDASFAQITAGRPFYIAGLSFLMLGVVFGTGLWLGWGEFLHAAAPKEIHLHANLWGFASLTFAGLLTDLYPKFAGRSLAMPRSFSVILGLFIIGDLALIVAPWIGNMPMQVIGMLLHHAATALVVFNIVKPLVVAKEKWNPGFVHLVAAYAWILVTVVAAPVMIMGSLQASLIVIEAHAPLILVFGWVLQFMLALAPYILSRAFSLDQAARLGGSWVSVFVVNLGTAFIVVAIVSEAYQALFGGIAFGLWALAIIDVAWDVWKKVLCGNESELAL